MSKELRVFILVDLIEGKASVEAVSTTKNALAVWERHWKKWSLDNDYVLEGPSEPPWCGWLVNPFGFKPKGRTNKVSKKAVPTGLYVVWCDRPRGKKSALAIEHPNTGKTVGEFLSFLESKEML